MLNTIRWSPPAVSKAASPVTVVPIRLRLVPLDDVPVGMLKRGEHRLGEQRAERRARAHLLDRDPARQVARAVPAHAVRDHEKRRNREIAVLVDLADTAHGRGCAMAEADHFTCRRALARVVHGSPLRAFPSWPFSAAACQRMLRFGVYCLLLAGSTSRRKRAAPLPTTPPTPPDYRVGRARGGQARARCYFCSCFLPEGAADAAPGDRPREARGSRPYGSRRCGGQRCGNRGAWWPRKRCLPPPSRHPGPPHLVGVPSRSESLSQDRGPRRSRPENHDYRTDPADSQRPYPPNRSQRLTVNSRAVG